MCGRVARARVPDDDRAAARARRAAARVGDDAAWAALFERPIGELDRACLDDDLVRGIVATDALIGTFAGAHDADLRQNRCFLYHVIGNGTGDWDVPDRRHGRGDRRARRRRRAAPGAELRYRRRGRRDRAGRPTVAVRWRDAAAARASRRARTCWPTSRRPCSTGCSARTPAASRARGRAAQGQPAAQAAAAAARRAPSTRATRSPAPSTSTRATRSSKPPTRRRRRGGSRSAAVRDLLPLADRPVDPRARAARGGRADADLLRPAHCPRGCSRPTPTARASRAAGHARVAGQRARRARRSTAWRDADGRPCVEAKTPAGPRGRAADARRQHLPPRPELAVRRERGRVGTWGVETDDPRVLLCGAGARRGGGVSGVPGRNAAMAVLHAGVARLRARRLEAPGAAQRGCSAGTPLRAARTLTRPHRPAGTPRAFAPRLCGSGP